MYITFYSTTGITTYAIISNVRILDKTIVKSAYMNGFLESLVFISITEHHITTQSFFFFLSRCDELDFCFVVAPFWGNASAV